jgi:hypothetical protein
MGGWSTMMKKIFLLTIACAVAILPLTAVEAFWSQLGFSIHQDITKDALNRTALYTYQGAAPGFSEKAINAIVTQNANQDDEAGMYAARDHFDSEELTQGFQLLQINRTRLRAALAGPNINQTYAWQQMGKMVHQIQDFYSHSNWIASGHTDIRHFAALTAIAPSGNPPVTPPTGEKFCAPDLATLLPNVADITTGYYPPHSPLAAPLVGKCSHGEITKVDKGIAGAACVLNFSTTGTYPDPHGIARDHACGTTEETADYVNAYNKAILETVEFVKAITDELAAANNGPGFCALLDVQANDPICQGAVSVGPALYYVGPPLFSQAGREAPKPINVTVKFISAVPQGTFRLSSCITGDTCMPPDHNWNELVSSVIIQSEGVGSFALQASDFSSDYLVVEGGNVVNWNLGVYRAIVGGCTTTDGTAGVFAANIGTSGSTVAVDPLGDSGASLSDGAALTCIVYGNVDGGGPFNGQSAPGSLGTWSQ